jgi:hypothetical protein
VTFDPTPAAAPAATQLNDNALGVTEPTLPIDKGSSDTSSDPRGGTVPQPKSQPGQLAHRGSGGSGPRALLILGGIAGGLALLALGGYGRRRLRTQRLDPNELAEAELDELERALARLGRPLPPGATLLTAEKHLAHLGGPIAASYASELRERRYRRSTLLPPSLARRRSLRRALRRGRSPWAPDRPSAIGILRAIPPGGPTPRKAPAGRLTSRPVRRSHPPSASEAGA